MTSPDFKVSARPRLASVDAWRGLVLVVMALDHTRDFFNRAAMQFSPEDLTRTTPAIFLTRWVTHFCAPVFFFVAGIGAFLWWHPPRTRAQLSHFLWTRGLWLAFVELTFVHYAMFLGFRAGPYIVTVLWGLGWAMVALAVLVWLPRRVLAVLSIAVIAFHNLVDPVSAASLGHFAWLWKLTHELSPIQIGPFQFTFPYTFVPWFAVMSAGYCFGSVFRMDAAARRRQLLGWGFGLTAAFLIIRTINRYGDPSPWSRQPRHLFTILSFLRCSKYPASLDFLLMTLGPALLLLAWFGTLNFGMKNPLIVFGRVPFFYFVLHLYLIHAIAFPLAWLRYGHTAFLLNPFPSMGGSPADYPANFGYSLWASYLIWICAVIALYPLCWWYGRLKQRHPGGVFSYL